jgi:hypothetical protein
VPGIDHTVSPRICALNIRSWTPSATRHARATSGIFVTGVGDDSEQFLNTIAAVCADRVEHRGLSAGHPADSALSDRDPVTKTSETGLKYQSQSHAEIRAIQLQK